MDKAICQWYLYLTAVLRSVRAHSWVVSDTPLMRAARDMSPRTWALKLCKAQISPFSTTLSVAKVQDEFGHIPKSTSVSLESLCAFLFVCPFSVWGMGYHWSNALPQLSCTIFIKLIKISAWTTQYDYVNN